VPAALASDASSFGNPAKSAKACVHARDAGFDSRRLCDPRSREVCPDSVDFQRRRPTKGGVSTVNVSLHNWHNVVNLYFFMFNLLQIRDIGEPSGQQEEGREHFSGTPGRVLPDFMR
jgi:hypothetical protein